MARNDVRFSTEQGLQTAWQRGGWRLVLFGSMAPVTGVLTCLVLWDILERAPGLWEWVGVGTACILLAFSLDRALSGTHLGHRWRCRTALLLSASLPIWVVGLRWISQETSSPWRVVGLLWLAFAGAFTGCLLSTFLEYNLWENNSPPSPGAQDEVLQRHIAWIGKPQAEPWAKRCFDISLALMGLVLSAPVWAFSVFLIWFEDPGPILFVKNSVGKGGANFRQYKLRTMVRSAEADTGPVLAQQGDGRVLRFGRLLRKTALDELPQLINILRGEMSFVGPRPQRTVLVAEYLQHMPEYAERHRALPGLAGLAQVAGDYYLTPRQKLRFDRVYIRHCSLGFDLKLLALAFLITFWFRWQKDWNGRLPRRLLHGRR